MRSQQYQHEIISMQTDTSKLLLLLTFTVVILVAARNTPNKHSKQIDHLCDRRNPFGSLLLMQ